MADLCECQIGGLGTIPGPAKETLSLIDKTRMIKKLHESTSNTVYVTRDNGQLTFLNLPSMQKSRKREISQDDPGQYASVGRERRAKRLKILEDSNINIYL